MNVGPESAPAAEIERLHTNRAVQDFLVKRLLGHGHKAGDDLEPILHRAELICRVAAGLPGGNLANPHLENFLLETGMEITADVKTWDWGVSRPPKHDRSRSILHVATTVHSIGGHSRVIGSWIELDRDSQHFLALTDQIGPVPP